MVSLLTNTHSIVLYIKIKTIIYAILKGKTGHNFKRNVKKSHNKDARETQIDPETNGDKLKWQREVNA